MSVPNGNVQPEGEPVNYADVLEYYAKTVAELHSQISVARAQIANRDRVILGMREEINARNAAKESEENAT